LQDLQSTSLRAVRRNGRVSVLGVYVDALAHRGAGEDPVRI
jgi:hypothetical protein